MRKRAVICDHLDKVWPSLTAAAKELNVSKFAILRRIRYAASDTKPWHGKLGHLTFSYVENSPERLSVKTMVKRCELVCIETGDTYYSVRAAITALRCSSKTMYRHLNGEKADIKGFTYKRVIIEAVEEV